MSNLTTHNIFSGLDFGNTEIKEESKSNTIKAESHSMVKGVVYKKKIRREEKEKLDKEREEELRRKEEEQKKEEQKLKEDEAKRQAKEQKTMQNFLTVSSTQKNFKSTSKQPIHYSLDGIQVLVDKKNSQHSKQEYKGSDNYKRTTENSTKTDKKIQGWHVNEQGIEVVKVFDDGLKNTNKHYKNSANKKYVDYERKFDRNGQNELKEVDDRKRNEQDRRRLSDKVKEERVKKTPVNRVQETVTLEQYRETITKKVRKETIPEKKYSSKKEDLVEQLYSMLNFKYE